MSATETDPTLEALETSEPPPTHLIASLVAVIVGSLVLRLAAQAMGQMLQYYFATIDREYVPLSQTTTALVTASFFITELIGSPLLGAMSDRYGRKLFIILGPLFGAIAVQITSMTVAIWLLVFTRLIEGLSTASSIPATLGYISEATTGRPNLRARVVGLFELTFAGGIAMGSVLAGYMWEYFGKPVTLGSIRIISPAFCINGLIYLASLAIFAWGLKDFKRSARPLPSSAGTTGISARLGHYAVILKSPRVWWFAPAWLAVNSIIGMWVNLSVRMLTGKDHYPGQLLMGSASPEGFGKGYGFVAVVFALGVLGWSFLIGRYRKTSMMLVATGGLFVTLGMIFVFNRLSTFDTPFYWPLIAGMVAGLVVLSSFTPAALTYLADVTESFKMDRGSIMGLYSVFLGIGQVIGTTTGGLFAQWKGIDGLLLLSAIFGVITVGTLFELRRKDDD